MLVQSQIPLVNGVAAAGNSVLSTPGQVSATQTVQPGLTMPPTLLGSFGGNSALQPAAVTKDASTHGPSPGSFSAPPQFSPIARKSNGSEGVGVTHSQFNFSAPPPPTFTITPIGRKSKDSAGNDNSIPVVNFIAAPTLPEERKGSVGNKLTTTFASNGLLSEERTAPSGGSGMLLQPSLSLFSQDRKPSNATVDVGLLSRPDFGLSQKPILGRKSSASVDAHISTLHMTSLTPCPNSIKAHLGVTATTLLSPRSLLLQRRSQDPSSVVQQTSAKDETLDQAFTALESVDEVSVTRQQELSSQMLGLLASGAPEDYRTSHAGVEQHDPAMRKTVMTNLEDEEDAEGLDFDLTVQPPREGLPWTKAHLDKLVIFLQNHGDTQTRLHPVFVSRVLRDFAHKFQNLAHVPVRHMEVPKTPKGKLVVFGDTHGQLNDVLWVLYKNGMPSKEISYLWNGDVADRGRMALEIFMVIYVAWLLYPDNVCMNRGNHEDAVINMDPNCGGFYMEVFEKYGNTFGGRLWDEMVHTYTLLPVATVIDNKVFVVHGGLCRQPRFLTNLKAIPSRKTTLPENTNTPAEVAYLDAMWSDPQPGPGFQPSTRGPSLIRFGPDVTQDFLNESSFDLVVRSHQPPSNKDGVFYHHENKLITVFSASNYCGWYGNTGAVLIFWPGLNHTADRHFSPTFEDLRDVEIIVEPVTPIAVHQRKLSVMLLEQNAIRKSFGVDPEKKKLRTDVKARLARIIVENKQSLWTYWSVEDNHIPKGTVTEKQFKAGLEVVFGKEVPLKLVNDIIEIEKVSKRIDYIRFLQKYRCEIREAEGSEYRVFATTSWMEDILGNLYGRLMRENLGWSELFSRFDGAGIGLVPLTDFHRELVASGSGALSLDQTSQVLRVLAAFSNAEIDKDAASVDVGELLSRLEVIYARVKKSKKSIAMAAESGRARNSSSLCASLLRSFSKALFAEKGTKSDSSTLLQSFKIADRDGSGFITLDEFRPAVRSMISKFPAIVQEMDSANLVNQITQVPTKGRDTTQNTSGSLLASEHTPTLRDELIDELFDYADVTGDGKVNYLEFLHCFQEPDRLDPEDQMLKTCLVEQVSTVIFMNKGALLKTFQVYDQTYSGKIDISDFTRVLHSLNHSLNPSSPPLTREQIIMLVAALDLSGNEVNYIAFLNAFKITGEGNEEIVQLV